MLRSEDGNELDAPAWKDWREADVQGVKKRQVNEEAEVDAVYVDGEQVWP